MKVSRLVLASMMSLGVVSLLVAPSLILETPVWAGNGGKASSSSSGGSQGGALGRTTRAVGAKTNSSPSSGGSSSGSNSGSSSSGYDSYDTRPVYYPGYYGGCYGCAPAGPSTQAGNQTARVSIDLGIQSVRNSDGAATAALRVASGRFAIGLDAIRYFEDTPADDGSDSVYMNLWAITAQGRLLDMGATSLWLQAGVGGTNSNNFEALSGAVIGAELAHVVNPNLDLYASGRYFILSEQMRASELRAGIGVSFLTLGYRTFAFEDAGEPLHGPEFGLSFGF